METKICLPLQKLNVNVDAQASTQASRRAEALPCVWRPPRPQPTSCTSKNSNSLILTSRALLQHPQDARVSINQKVSQENLKVRCMCMVSVLPPSSTPPSCRPWLTSPSQVSFSRLASLCKWHVIALTCLSHASHPHTRLNAHMLTCLSLGPRSRYDLLARTWLPLTCALRLLPSEAFWENTGTSIEEVWDGDSQEWHHRLWDPWDAAQ